MKAWKHIDSVKLIEDNEYDREHGVYSVKNIDTICVQVVEKMGKLEESLDYDVYMDWVMLIIAFNDALADGWRCWIEYKWSLEEKKVTLFNKLRPDQKSDAATNRLVDADLSDEIRVLSSWDADLKRLDRKYSGYSVKGMWVWKDYFFRMQQEIKATT